VRKARWRSDVASRCRNRQGFVGSADMAPSSAANATSQAKDGSGGGRGDWYRGRDDVARPPAASVTVTSGTN
jgi:hypothetical protein